MPPLPGPEPRMRVVCWASDPPHRKLNAKETPTEINLVLGKNLGTETAMPCMKSRDESREEVSTRTESLAKLKQRVAVGAWNVRTTYKTDRSVQIVKEMKALPESVLPLRPSTDCKM